MCSVIRRPDQVAKRATGIALSRPSSRPGKAPGSIECGHTCSEEHPRQDHMARCCQLQGHVEATGASQPPPPRAGGRCQAARVNRPAEPGTMAPGHGWPGWDAHRVGQQTPGMPMVGLVVTAPGDCWVPLLVQAARSRPTAAIVMTEATRRWGLVPDGGPGARPRAEPMAGAGDGLILQQIGCGY